MTEVICGKEKIVLLKDSFLYEVVKRKDSFYFKKIEPLEQNGLFESYSFIVDVMDFQQKVIVVKKANEGVRTVVVNRNCNNFYKTSLLNNCVLLTPCYEKGSYLYMLLHETIVLDAKGNELSHDLPALHVISPLWEVHTNYLKVSTMGGETYHFMRISDKFVEVEAVPKEEVIPYGVLSVEQLKLTDDELKLLSGF